jgi:sporulation protein YlmC with PRC-barrel domain
MSVSTLKGHDVVNPAKGSLGKIEDLMIDLENDRI